MLAPRTAGRPAGAIHGAADTLRPVTAPSGIRLIE
jgi:hypothetical protein